MIAPPTFASIQEHVSRLGDADFRAPYLAEILERHDLAGAGREPVAGFNATYTLDELATELFAVWIG